MVLLLVDRGANVHAISQSLEKPADLTENELLLSFSIKLILYFILMNDI